MRWSYILFEYQLKGHYVSGRYGFAPNAAGSKQLTRTLSIKVEAH